MTEGWQEFFRGIGRWSADHLPKILLILVLALVVARVSRRVVSRFEDKIKSEDIETTGSIQRAATIAALVGGGMSIVVWAVASLSVLGELGIEIRPLLASAGIVGLALGFGAQSLVKDFLTGFFILLEGQYRVGDWVDVGDSLEEEGIFGMVEHFTLRRTSIRSKDGTLHHIANGEIKRSSNTSAEWSVAIVDIGIPAGEPMPRVTAGLIEAGQRLTADPDHGDYAVEPPRVLGLEDLSGGAMTVRVALRTVPGHRRETARAYRRYVKEVFDEVGVDLDPPDDVILHRPDRSAEANGQDEAEA